MKNADFRNGASDFQRKIAVEMEQFRCEGVQR